MLEIIMQMGAPAAAAIAALAFAIALPLTIHIVTRRTNEVRKMQDLERRVSLSENQLVRLERDNNE